MESVKSIAESKFRMCLIGNIKGIHYKDILQIFTVYLQVEKSSY